MNQVYRFTKNQNRATWEFIRKEGGHLEFATINPVAILGWTPISNNEKGNSASINSMVKVGIVKWEQTK